jgi:hypothetical protein
VSVVVRVASSPPLHTLMQDRKADRSTKTSCDARPDHTSGHQNPPSVQLLATPSLGTRANDSLGRPSVIVGRNMFRLR